ncbi:twin-arginine translocase subunit TatC [Deinococcus peraridilitoris]|uniref:Sec-independent protein translocase protein TatC n=1 Tax=Deinococcus peraridilitoris (strain DSM 19664 / LMG 22246 / CIP 109416 / KR-200) TaxID=937777 RepID=K9ZX70_DEIPD|nr:twin-arginine translocase subunit TatC [Deinococcus peraridilitoris]AFZ66156.1 twin arginine targeting protein translocase subunit TatC [Deinococcus peraridilitoris DSM 19664]
MGKLVTNHAEAPLLDHLEDLRKRLIIAVLFWLAGTSFAWFYRTELLEWLKRPLTFSELYNAGKLQLVSQQLTDQLIMSFLIAMWGGLALTLPFILHQVWLFVAPGLYAHERRWAAPFVLGAGFSFIIGAAFCYFVILPQMVPFLVDFLGGAVNGVYPIATYISQVVTFLVAFGIIFELPILSFVLTKIGIVNAGMMGRVRRPAGIVILIVAAVITPTTDPINLMLVAVPIYVLYELGIIVSRLAAPRGRAALAQE